MRKTVTKFDANVESGKVLLSWYKSTPLLNEESTDEFGHFRIYRKEETFVFGEDYEEYFLNTDNSDAHLIFDGSLDAINNRKYVFQDDSVEIGHTYSYFVQTKTSCRTGPIPVRVRDPEVWWSYEYLMSRLNDIRIRSKGDVRVSICGQTSMGRDIPCLEIGSGSKTLGFAGLIHGGEAGPELIVQALSELVDESPQLFRDVRVVAIPAVNIDSREKMVRGTPWYIRTNHQGVDLNRNFPTEWDTVEYGYGLDSSDMSSMTYRGISPASAPETQAVISVFEECRPDVVFSLHCLASICGLPALASKYAKEDIQYAGKCENFIKAYGRGLYPDLDFSDKWLSYGTSAGSLPAWLYERNKIPAFDLEGGADPDSLNRCKIDQTDRTLLQDYQKRHANAIKEVMMALTEI